MGCIPKCSYRLSMPLRHLKLGLRAGMDQEVGMWEREARRPHTMQTISSPSFAVFFTKWPEWLDSG
jgi:hypothetical protein